MDKDSSHDSWEHRRISMIKSLQSVIANFPKGSNPSLELFDAYSGDYASQRVISVFLTRFGQEMPFNDRVILTGSVKSCPKVIVSLLSTWWGLDLVCGAFSILVWFNHVPALEPISCMKIYIISDQITAKAVSDCMTYMFVFRIESGMAFASDHPRPEADLIAG